MPMVYIILGCCILYCPVVFLQVEHLVDESKRFDSLCDIGGHGRGDLCSMHVLQRAYYVQTYIV